MKMEAFEDMEEFSEDIKAKLKELWEHKSKGTKPDNIKDEYKKILEYNEDFDQNIEKKMLVKTTIQYINALHDIISLKNNNLKDKL